MKARFLINGGIVGNPRAWCVAAVVSTLLCVGQARAQNASASSSAGNGWSFGAYGALNVNLHTASFQALPNVPTGPANDPASFGNTSGLGFSAGVFGEMPLSELFALQLRVGYATHNARLLAREPQRIGVLNSANQATFYDATFERRLDPNLSSIGAEPLLVIAPFAGEANASSGLRVYAGARVGFMLTRTFNQIEALIDPSDSTIKFNNNDRLRNPQSGAIPDASTINLALTVGLGYNIRLGNISIAPEVFYMPSLTSVVNNLRWNVATLRAGVSLRFETEGEPQKTPPADTPPKDTTQKPLANNSGNPPTTDSTATTTSDSTATSPTDKPKLQHNPPVFQNSETNPQSTLSASIAAFSVDENGVEQPLVQLKVEQYTAQQMYPLMNYIFFEQGASDLQEKYRRINAADTADYDEQKFYSTSMLKIYYDILNVIGKRLRKYPKARITLTGCNNNVGTEVGNIPLSFRRANEIKRYWIDRWGIDSTRLTIRARNLPEKPTMSRDSLGIEENRRVEFTSDTWDIMKPVLVNDTIGIPQTPLIRFKMNAKADNGIAQSKLDVHQGSRMLKNFTVPGKPDSTLEWSPVMDWEAASDQGSIPKNEDDMKFTFEVTDNKGERVQPTGSIPVEMITVQKKKEAGAKDKEVAIFRLILFDFNSPAVGPTNGTIVKQFVLPKLKPGTKIQVTGFTDKLGNPDVNKRLSGARAKSVADYLKWPDTTWKGVGGTRPIYPNDTPEGRIYSRSVEVRCEIPIGGN